MEKSIFKTGLLACALAFTVISCEDDSVPNPVADFTFKTDAATMDVEFTNASTNAVGYSWNFGDGTGASTEMNPKHTYAVAGKYDVTLTAVGEVGSTPAEKKQNIEVLEPGGPNLLTGGTFETADQSAWTVLHSGQKDKDGNLINVKYEFGYTKYKPTLGTGGSLYIYPNNDAANPQHEEGTIFYKEIGQLTAGKYKISTLVKCMGENKETPTAAMANYWFEFLVRSDMPVEGDGYNNARVTGWYFGAWTGWNLLAPSTNGACPPIDGLLPHSMMNTNLADKDGNFTLDAAGKYYIVIKIGKGFFSDGNTFGEGIAIDDLKIKKAE